MRRRTGERALGAVAAVTGLLAAAASARAAAGGRLDVTAAVDRTELAADEVLVLTVRVESEAGSPALDLHEDALPFRVVSRSWSTDVSLGLGGGAGVGLVRRRVLTLELSPKRTGALVIPPIVATAKGVRRQTEPIRVQVTAAGGRPRAPAQPPDRSGGSWRGWERDLAVELQVDRREVFLGEPVIATISILSPVGVVRVESYQPPAFDGFWVEELERRTSLGFQVRDVNGVPLRAYLVQRLALFPTRAGTLEIGPLRMEVLVRLGSDALFSGFAELRRAARETAPVVVRVKPLPPGAPAGFRSVNVGAWKLEVSASERTVPAGQPVAIRLTASGEGNVRALALPSLPDLPGVRRFQPTASEDVQRRRGRVGGSRTLETVVVPDAPGELVVPPVAWPFFDLASGRYEVARTEELRIAVTPGAAEPAPDRGLRPAAAELRPIRADGALAARSAPPWARPPFLATLALPPLAFAALALADAWRRRRTAAAPSRRARRAGRRAERRLRAARARLAADPGAALSDVERALAGYARDRLGRGAAGLTRAERSRALVAAGAREAAAAALAAAEDACEAARFGGGTAAEEVLALAERALALLETSPWDARAGPR